MGDTNQIRPTNLLVSGTPYVDIRAMSPTVDISDGSVSAVAALNAAAAIGSPVLIPPGTYLIDSSVSCTASIVMSGGKFSVTTGTTLTIGGAFACEPVQAFSGAGAVAFGSGSVSKAYPQWWGAKGNGTDDDFAAIQAAINATGYGGTLVFPAGSYKITDTMLLNDKRGSRFVGGSRGEYGASGARIIWHGGNAKPIAVLDYFKGSTIENLTFIGADAEENLATACLVFKKGSLSGSSGPSWIRNCYFDNATYGAMLGDTEYDDTYNVSEITFEHCRFNCIHGLYIAGVASGGQNVNERLLYCDFGGALSQRGIWLAGGNVFCSGCSWNGSRSPSDFTALYIAGDVSMAIPTTIRDCYAEQISKFIETEFSSDPGNFSRQMNLLLATSFIKCNRTFSGTAMLVECYKNAEIELHDVVCTAGDIVYSPPADAASAEYSVRAPSTNCIKFSGKNEIQGAIASERGGYILSNDRSIRGTIPFGYMYPSEGILEITTAIKDLPEYGVYATYGDNGTFDLDSIGGGQDGDVIHLCGHPEYCTFRVPNIKHGTGNIQLAGATDFALSAPTKKVILRRDISGNWIEIGRIPS